MFTRRVSGRSLPRYVLALLLSSAASVFAQGPAGTGPGGTADGNPTSKPPQAQATEQRLFPHGLPKLEAMLKASLEHHPEILAARAKLRAAEAEQRQAELKALKDIMDIRDRWEKASQAAVATLPPNHPGILERLRNLAAIEWELAFLLGTRGEMHLTGDADAEPGRTAPQATPKPENASAPPAIESGIPRGEQGKLVKKLLGQAIPVDLEDMPLTDVVKYFSDQSGLRFVLDKQGLKNEGFPVDSPVTLKLKDAELGSALQALEDLHKPLSFVVRDYGILVTTKDYGPENAVSARDFWKLTDEEIRKKLRRDNRSGEMGGGRRVFLIHRVSH